MLEALATIIICLLMLVPVANILVGAVTGFVLFGVFGALVGGVAGYAISGVWYWKYFRGA